MEARLGSGSSTNSLPSAITTREGDGGLSEVDRCAYTVVRSAADPTRRGERLLPVEVDRGGCIVLRLRLVEPGPSVGQVPEAHRVCRESKGAEVDGDSAPEDSFLTPMQCSLPVVLFS